MPTAPSSYDEPDGDRPPTRHRDIDDHAVRDLLSGDYSGIGPRRHGPSAPAAPLKGTPDYQPDDSPNYAIAQYDGANRVCRVVAPFGNPVSAEEFAIAGDMVRYDVVPATRVVRRSR